MLQRPKIGYFMNYSRIEPMSDYQMVIKWVVTTAILTFFVEVGGRADALCWHEVLLLTLLLYFL